MTDRWRPRADDRLEAAIRELVAVLREEVLAEARALQAGPPRLLSLKQAAEACGLSRSAFYRLVQTREIRTLKVGGRRLVPESALRAFIDGTADP
jgi:excisionase family DNA binding protein